jgi:hypothetical protein
MAEPVGKLRELYDRAVRSWSELEFSRAPEDQHARTLPRSQCVAERLERVGKVIDDLDGLCKLDFLPHLNDMRGLYWDAPATETEQKAIDDAATLCRAVFSLCGGRRAG